jgi:Flp pilus assembly protein TadB
MPVFASLAAWLVICAIAAGLWWGGRQQREDRRFRRARGRAEDLGNEARWQIYEVERRRYEAELREWERQRRHR